MYMHAEDLALVHGKHWFKFLNIDIARIFLSIFPATLTCAGHLELLAGHLTTPAFKRTKCYNSLKHINDCLNPDFLLLPRFNPHTILVSFQDILLNSGTRATYY